MEISSVMEYLWEILPHEGAEVTAHRINRSNARAIGGFLREGRVVKVGTIGGNGYSTYDIVRVTLLVRWGRDGAAAEKKSVEIYKAIDEADFWHEEREGFMMAVNEGPVWLGMDDKGIFETVIDFNLYLEKRR
ncbi:MAG: minor capsid protein [Defluviitaleaceae bacterium]|nr:minor capsid protein [Defluviitaleaceae bacterium]